jgi:antitoxin component YwqK of YwqJK toxin-antitoxin module
MNAKCEFIALGLALSTFGSGCATVLEEVAENKLLVGTVIVAALPAIAIDSVTSKFKIKKKPGYEERNGDELYFKGEPFTGIFAATLKSGEEDLRGAITYKDGRKHGPETWWYADERKKSEGTYRDGKLDGLFTEWHSNGQKKQEGTNTRTARRTV